MGINTGMAASERENDPSGESIEGLFHALESPLLGYAMRLLGNVAASQDIVQESFMRLHIQFDRVRDRRAWLYRTVHNLALNHRRDGQKIVALERGGEEEDASRVEEAMDLKPLPDEQIARTEGIGLVRLSVEALGTRDRELIRLKFEEGLSYKEISERTGLTVGHVGYLLHHTLKALATEVTKAGLMP